MLSVNSNDENQPDLKRLEERALEVAFALSPDQYRALIAKPTKEQFKASRRAALASIGMHTDSKDAKAALDSAPEHYKGWLRNLRSESIDRVYYGSRGWLVAGLVTTMLLSFLATMVLLGFTIAGKLPLVAIPLGMLTTVIFYRAVCLEVAKFDILLDGIWYNRVWTTIYAAVLHREILDVAHPAPEGWSAESSNLTAAWDAADLSWDLVAPNV